MGYGTTDATSQLEAESLATMKRTSEIMSEQDPMSTTYAKSLGEGQSLMPTESMSPLPPPLEFFCHEMDVGLHG